MNKHRWVLRVPLLLAALLLWLVVAAPVRALDPGKSFHHYVRNTWSLQQGLPQISVQAIAQDRRGYLWVGTQSGLARFDGIRFVTYTPDDTPGIPGIWIRSLYLDKAGKLWIGTYKGLAVHDGNSFSSIAVAGKGDAGVLDIFDIREMDGRLMVASNQGLYALQDGVLQHQPGSPAVTQSLLPRSDGLWIGSLGGVVSLQWQGPASSWPCLQAWKRPWSRPWSMPRASSGPAPHGACSCMTKARGLRPAPGPSCRRHRSPCCWRIMTATCGSPAMPASRGSIEVHCRN